MVTVGRHDGGALHAWAVAGVHGLHDAVIGRCGGGGGGVSVRLAEAKDRSFTVSIQNRTHYTVDMMMEGRTKEGLMFW